MSGTAQILKNAAVLHAGNDISGQISSTTLVLSADILDKTTIDLDSRSKMVGMRDSNLALNGFFASGSNNVDDQFNDDTIYPAVTSVCNSKNVGGIGYHLEIEKSEYSISAQQGKLIPFSFTAEGTGTVARGPVVITGSLSSGNSPIINLGAISADEKIWAVAQLDTVGTSVDIDLYEDTTDDFSDDPQLVGSMPQMTDAGGYVTRFTGPVTGLYYRLQITVSGSCSGTLFIAKGA